MAASLASLISAQGGLVCGSRGQLHHSQEQLQELVMSLYMRVLRVTFTYLYFVWQLAHTHVQGQRMLHTSAYCKPKSCVNSRIVGCCQQHWKG
eukprot:3694171-Amphidinium_carterae.1